jgi:hypothetical protein
MSRFRPFGAALVLVLLAACADSDPLAVDTADVMADDDLTSELVLAEGGDPRRSGGAPLFERLAAAIPGFGGLYRTERCVVAVVLTADADAEAAVRIVHAAIEPLVVRTCPDGIRVDAVRGQFTYIQLHRYLLAARPLFSMPGVAGAYIDVKRNRLVMVVLSRRVADAVQAALPRVDIPVEAVAFTQSTRRIRS